MASEVQSMLRQSIKAFVERDTDLALEVIGRDKLVDAEYKEAARRWSIVLWRIQRRPRGSCTC